MSICKYALRIAARHPFYLAIYVGFLSVMGVFMLGMVSVEESSGTAEAEAVAYRASVAFVDRDGSELSRALRKQTGAADELVDVADESFALQDALATSQVDVVLIAPKGFGAEFMAAARAGDELPQLDAAYGSDLQAGMLAAQRATRWLSLAATEAALDTGATDADVVAATRKDAAHEAETEFVRGESGTDASAKLAFYLRFSSYSVTSSIVVVAGVVFAALSEPEVRRRQLASPVSTWSQGAQALAGCALLTLAVCAWVSVVGLVAAGALHLLVEAPAQVALALLALVVFSFTPFALAYLLAQLGLREEALNSIANLGGMIMSFLGGAWISLSLLGESVQAVARFTPTYWMTQAVDTALEASAVTGEVLASVALDLGIIVLFAVAIATVGLVVSRNRRVA